MPLKQKLGGKFRRGDVAPVDRIGIPGLDVAALNHEITCKRMVQAAVGRQIIAPDEICALAGLLEVHARDYKLEVERIPLQPALLLSNTIMMQKQRADSLEATARSRLTATGRAMYSDRDIVLTVSGISRKVSKPFVRYRVECSPAYSRIEDERDALRGIQGLDIVTGAFRVALIGVRGVELNRFVDEVKPIFDQVPGRQITFGPFDMFTESCNL